MRHAVRMLERVVRHGQLALAVCDSEGSGPDVLLLHGLGCNLAFWNLMEPLLAFRFRLVSVDRLCCVDGWHRGGEGCSMKRTRRPRPPVTMPSGFTGFRFPPEVILLAVRWYLRYGLSYRDLEELLAERGIEVDHVTLYRWVQRFTPLLIDAARPVRHVRETAGLSTRPMSRSPGSGAMSTGRSTSMAR